MCYMDYVPFVYHRDQEQDYRVDVKSLIQAAIIAIGTGLIVMYGTQKTLAVQLESIEEDVRQIKDTQQRFRNDFYYPQHSSKPGIQYNGIRQQ